MTYNLAEILQKQSNINKAREEFWGRRPFLQLMHDAAKAKLKNPWSMLAVTLARVSASIEPHVVTPSTIKSKYGSLNLFVAITGDASAGKTTLLDISRHAYVVHGEPPMRPVGSGEGWLSYIANKDGVVNSRSLFYADEGGFLIKTSKREGSTLLPIMRSLWAGAATGTTNAEASRTRVLPAHQYRTCLVVGMQDTVAAAILGPGEQALGTPQRFLWVEVVDSGKAHFDKIPSMPKPMHFYPSHISWSDTVMPALQQDYDPYWQYAPMTYEHGLQRAIDRALYDGDQAGGMDGHAIYAQCKVALLLALVDGYRREANLEDWELAGVIMGQSNEVRESLIIKAERGRDREAKKRGRAKAIEQVAQEDSVRAISVARVANAIARKFKGQRGVSRRDVARSIAGRDKDYREDAIDALLADARMMEVVEAGSDKVVYNFS